MRDKKTTRKTTARLHRLCLLVNDLFSQMMSDGSDASTNFAECLLVFRKCFSCQPGSSSFAPFKILLNLQARMYPSSVSNVMKADLGRVKLSKCSVFSLLICFSISSTFFQSWFLIASPRFRSSLMIYSFL